MKAYTLCILFIWTIAFLVNSSIAEDFNKFHQWDKEVLASPFDSPSSDDGIITSVGPGRTAGGLIGFIITCLMVIICFCFMVPLCLRWVFVTIRKVAKSRLS